MLEMRDVDEAHIEDVFRVCSHAKCIILITNFL